MLRKQAFVLLVMTFAVLVLALLRMRGSPNLPFPIPNGDDVATRVAFVARWLLLAGFCVLIGIAQVANRRFFIPDAIDGTRTPQNHALEINLRYNRNTLEQTVLAAIAWTGLALALPHERLACIPALAILFVVARALFWIGYLIAPAACALGFALTFYPTAQRSSGLPPVR
jgi:hypothetical protein